MKIITYNIWNSDCNFDIRLKQLIKLLIICDADIVALQEVRNSEILETIRKECGFKYALWETFDNEEGLALLSKHPVVSTQTNWAKDNDIHNSYVVRTVIECNNKKLGFTNIHLDYESALNREIEIVKAMNLIDEYKECEYELLLGDLNTYPESSVYRYITGQQSLKNHATIWADVYKFYSHKSGTQPRATLDFLKNPRWENENVIELPGRFDYIMLKYSYPKEDPKIISANIIGDIPIEGITPSDHYGVMCEIDF